MQGHAGAIIAILVILLAGLWRAARHCRKLDRDADVLARTNGMQAILGLLDQLDEAEKEISSLADGQPKSVSTWGSIQDNGLYLVRAIGQRADGNLYLGGNDRVCKGWQVKQLMERCYAALAIPEWPGLPAKEVPLSD